MTRRSLGRRTGSRSMPVILPQEHHEAWLTGEAGKEVLIPFPGDQMKTWQISPRVKAPKNDDLEIITPVEVEFVARPEAQPQLL